MTNKDIITLATAYGFTLFLNNQGFIFTENTSLGYFRIEKGIGKKAFIEKATKWLQINRGSLTEYLKKQEIQKVDFQSRIINKENFFDRTNVDFKQSKRPENFVQFDFASRSGSKYYYTNEGVYRYSDHWGACASCFWTFEGRELGMNFEDIENKSYKWGFAKWSEFSNADFKG